MNQKIRAVANGQRCNKKNFMKKYLKVLIVLLIVAVVVPQVALAAWWNPFSWNWGQLNRVFHFQQWFHKTETPIVGNNKDEHGCIGSAGYSWCEAKQKCLRPWEEACEISGDVYPIFSGAKWGNAVAKTITEPITDVEINGYEIIAQGKINQNQDAYKFFDFYDKKLKKAGWAVDNNFAADGIKGSQVGYKKDNNYIVLSYNITPGEITSGKNEPLRWTCPCDVTYTVFAGSTNTIISGKEQVCVASGGKVLSVDCYCSGPKDFYNNCAIGACTCTPDPKYKREIRICDCGEGKCWNGSGCVVQIH